MTGSNPKQPEGRSSPRLETVVGVVFLALTSLFLVEVHHYVNTGSWVLHGGHGAFSNWPMASSYNLELFIHAFGMLAWMGVVVHQLLTRGAGAHETVGRIGALGVIVALLISLRPMLASKVPILHGLLGLTLMDLTLTFTVLGIIEEMSIGVYKVRRGKVEAHRKHLMVSVLFTAGPAFYRVNTRVLMGVLDLGRPDAEIWKTAWAHELSLAVAFLVIASLMLTRRFGGHLDVLRAPREHDAIERAMARFMVSLITILCVLYLVWIVDLLLMWPQGGRLLTRQELSGFVVDFLGLGPRI